MTRDFIYEGALKDVFPLLDGKDLASCMQVCRQWRDIGRDDYFWKCACGKRWPSVCKRPPSISYHKLFATFSKPQSPRPLLPSRLSFEDLEFYIDLWSDSLIFSEAVSGTMLRKGIKNPPAGVPDTLMAHMNNSDYKMMMPVDPIFTLIIGQKLTVSVMVSRKDTKQMACLLNQSLFEYYDTSAFLALAYDYLTFAPKHPFISGIRAWVSLLFMIQGDDEHFIDVFGIEIDFCDAASSENEVLWLLDMLDWK